MSIPPPDDPNHPDQPTQPLGVPVPPAAPVAPAPRVREREVVADEVVEPEFDPRFALAQLQDGLRSLRTAVVMLGLVSIAALALGAYALYQAEDNERTNGDAGSSNRVAQLEDRVQELEQDLDRRTRGTAESGDVNAVEKALDDKADAEDVQALEDQIAELGEQRQQPAEADPETAQAIADLSERLDDLEQQFQEAQQQAP